MVSSPFSRGQVLCAYPLKGLISRARKPFFERNQKYMTYAPFFKRGLHIGSGPVETACKIVVKTRMGRSGMRWNRQSGQHVLNLRAYALSDQWDEFWDTKIKLKNTV